MKNYSHYACSDCTKSIEAAEKMTEVAKQSVEFWKTLPSNNFESTLDMVEEFLKGFELCDHTMHFDCIASILRYVLDRFDALDTDKDGCVSKTDLRHSSGKDATHAREFEWLLCHFDALTHASVFPNQHNITRDCLLNAERLFSGLAFVQAKLKTPQISTDDLVALQNDAATTPAQRVAIGELLRYLERRHRHNGDNRISAEELDEISPEAIWE